MVKARKILSVLVALLLVACAFVLFGCSGTTTAQIYQNIQDFITKTTSDASFIDANNSFKNFQKYNDSGALETSDENQQKLLQIVMEYIKTNVWQFEEYTENHDYGDLEQKLASLNDAFDEAKERHDDLVTSAPNSSQLVYNGFATSYQSACIDFINKAYDFALSMQKTFVNDMKLLDFDFASITVDQANFYLDTIRLSLADDCRLFFLDSCKGEKIDQVGEFSAVAQTLTNIQNISDATVTYQKGEAYVALRQVEQALANERTHLQEALSAFSFYDYQNIYERNIDSYANNLENAEIYLETIDNYFYADNSFANSYIGKFFEKIATIY